MTKVECRMTKRRIAGPHLSYSHRLADHRFAARFVIRPWSFVIRIWSFVIRVSSLIRHSSFVIRH